MSEENVIHHDVENKQLKEENEKLKKENENEKVEIGMRKQKLKTRKEKLQMRMKHFLKNKIVKEKPKEIKSPTWIAKNKFEKVLAIIDSNRFNYKNKIGEFKYTDIKDLVNNIKNNTISEIDAKKDLNKLNQIKIVETMKYKKRTPVQKELLNLFNDLLDIIITGKTLESESQEDENKNENWKVESKNGNEKAEIRKEENEYEYENEDENEDKY